jgi:hypothetical protein
VPFEVWVTALAAVQEKFARTEKILADQLLSNCKRPESIMRENGLLRVFNKVILEWALASHRPDLTR